MKLLNLANSLYALTLVIFIDIIFNRNQAKVSMRIMEHKSDIRLFLFVLPLILVAGCTGLPDIFPGQDVIKPALSTQEEGFRDVLVIKEIGTIPKSPVLAGQTFLLSFIIENRDKEKEATGVVVDLFDAPLFKDKDGTELCNKVKCVPDDCTENKKCTVLPGEQKQITFELKAPDDKAIASLQTDLDINFRVTYKFSGSTLFKVVVVNLEEIKARQRAGSPLTLDILKSLGSGPVKIDAELKGAPYILSGLGGTLAFTVKNTGDTSKGSISESKIPEILQGPFSFGLQIKFPEELVKDVGNLVSPSAFLCVGPTEGSIDCFNKADITLFKGESVPLLFQIKNAPSLTAPFKSFDIKALLRYTYELRDSTKITVLPLAKVQ